jgi:uncharacterized membrane protein
MNLKPVIIYAFAFLLFILLLILTYRLIPEAPAQTYPATGPFSQALWNQWGTAILILAFISLAGGASVLVLLGGGWRWS